MKKIFKNGGPNILLGYLIPFVIIGLAIADFIPDQKIDKILLGMLLIFGLGALGWRLDEIVGKDQAGSVAGDPGAAIPDTANAGIDKNVANDTTEPR